MPAALAALARSVLCVGFVGTKPSEIALAQLQAFGPGGCIIFGRNVGNAVDLRASIAALRACGDIPPLIAVDQEGGRVARITDPALVAQIPAAMALAAGGDVTLCEQAGLLVGRDLARLGISVNFAPCADVASDAANTVIGTRSFGDRPDTVAQFSTAFARGLERGGVAATLKHFPGHGATATDSHLALPRVAQDLATLRARDLIPFADAIGARAASIVMTAHVVIEALDPTAPATLSSAVLSGMLRGELGFEGVIATDCLEMAAIAETLGTPAGAVRALAAGADLLLVSQHFEAAQAAAEAIERAVADGTLPRERLIKASERVWRLRERYATAAPYADPIDATVPLRAAQRALTVVRGDVRLRAGLPVTVVSFEGIATDGTVEASRVPAPSLSTALRARRWKSELMRVPLEPQADDLDLLLTHLRALGDRNFILVLRRAYLVTAQRAAIEQILAVIPGAIVLSAREPYDAAIFPSARNLACSYGDEALSLLGCADVLSDRVRAGGRLPVSLDRTVAVR